MPTIKIRQGHEYRTYVSDIYDSEALYYPQYMQAGKCVDEIMVRLDQFLEHDTIQSSEFDYDEPYYDLYDDFSNAYNVMGYANNIIGFCAKRGQGKTSAMLAVVNALVNEAGEKEERENFWNKAHKKNLALTGEKKNVDSHKVSSPVLNKAFFALRSIDPTTMEKSSSVLEIIVNRMFQKAKYEHYINQKKSRRNSREEEENYRSLLDQFQQMHKKVKELKQGDKTDPFDEISSIDETGDSRSTKYAFVDLVKAFLRYIKKDVLIIPVDDADLTPTRVFEVVEDIRKYCVSPRVMVLMAVHLGTLRTCIEQEYVKNYSLLLKSSYDTDHMKRYQCREMAERYVDKLIPDLHQIHLPYIDDKVRDGDSDLKLRYLAANPSGDPANDEDLLKYGGIESYQAQLFRLIYEKTGVILTQKNGYLHNFLPRRYREIAHMLSFFTRMTDIQVSGEYTLEKLIAYIFYNKLNLFEKDAAKRNVWIKNLPEILERRTRNIEQLESFFFEHWCPIYLTKNQCAKLNKIRTAPLSLKNKQTIEILKAYCIREHGNEFGGDVDSFPDSEQIITYGKVMDALATVKQRLDNPFKFDFVYAVQMYYTIYLNKILVFQMERHYKEKKIGTYPEMYKLILELMGSKEKNEKTIRSGGSLCRYNKGCSVVYAASLGASEDYFASEWFYSCDKKGYPIDNPYWYCYDPFQYMLFLLNKDCFDGKKGILSDERAAVKKFKITRIAWVLEYICNYDVQYYAYKKLLERIPSVIHHNPMEVTNMLYGFGTEVSACRIVSCVEDINNSGIPKTKFGNAKYSFIDEEAMWRMALDKKFIIEYKEIKNFVLSFTEAICMSGSHENMSFALESTGIVKLGRIPAFKSFVESCLNEGDLDKLLVKLHRISDNGEVIHQKINRYGLERFLRMEGGIEYILNQIQEENRLNC